MAARVRPAGIVVPKAEQPGDVERVDRELGSVIPLFLMVETAAGVLHAESLARSSPRVSGLIFGAADFRESIRAARLPDEREIFFARNTISLAARAAGAEVFDTPWFDYRDVPGLEASALRARELGFDGKTAIHPSQMTTINRVFSPTDAEIARARQIVAVMEEAMRNGRAVAALEGEMFESLHLAGARRVLERARLAGLTG
jgi:citrate lyase subunit beta/citryl-CoA lyase